MQKHIILDFINQFSQHSDTKTCFSSGMSYWFAHILKTRFEAEAVVQIMYAPSVNHFACQVNESIYDITGDVFNKYSWISWEAYQRQNFHQIKDIFRQHIYKL